MSQRLRFNPRGFTLVELLVVIGIIALLISILLPALNKAKAHAARAACLSNTKQLTTAYLMYADENRDYMPNGHPDLATSEKFVPVFIGNRRDARGGNTDWAIENGSLHKFLKNLKVWKCPGDPTLRKVSYGVNHYLNGEPGMVGGCGPYVLKRSQVKRSSRVFVFIDEYDWRDGDALGYNRGAFGIKPFPDNTWVDYPAPYHLGGTVVSFLDSHCEYIQWDLQTTRFITTNNTGAPDPRDLRKLQKIRGGLDANGKELAE